MVKDSYYARLFWQDGIPKSQQFNDVYFSSTSGSSEASHVFLTHNDLAKRFAKLGKYQQFTIAESGFGFGINFLMTLKLWRATAAKTTELNFISFELEPVSVNDLKKALALFPELSSEAIELESCYQMLTPTTHCLHFAPNVNLILVIGDINNTISRHQFTADAWFLDGFAPAKNQLMWSHDLFTRIVAKSQQKTTFATYTASLFVQRTLRDLGAKVIKDHGFSKREMLYGLIRPECGGANSQETIKSPNKAYLARYTNQNVDRRVVVIGGGISGAATAYSLARRGYQVTLYEERNALATGASGNLQGVLFANFCGNFNKITEFNLSGFLYSHNLIGELLECGRDYQDCGLLQLFDNIKQGGKAPKITNYPDDFCYVVTKAEIARLTAAKVGSDAGLYFPQGLWLRPRALAKKLAAHPNITVVTNCKIDELKLAAINNWQILKNGQELDRASNIVLCNSYQAAKFIQLKELELQVTKGQISRIKDPVQLSTIICGSGYIIPDYDGYLTVGASFSKDINDLSISALEQQNNLAIAKQLLAVPIENDNDCSFERVGLRASTYDYLPLVGPISQFSEFKDIYGKLALDKNYPITTRCPYLPGLYINIAHGSKGMVSAPLAGEIIASYINNSPMSCSEEIRQAIHPNRMWLRQLLQNKHGST